MLPLQTNENLNALPNESNKPWFAHWFNTPWYHVLYGNRDDAEADEFISRLSATLVTHFHIGQALKVLDLACGAGRHARVFASLGHTVTGLDLSEASIDTAQEVSDKCIEFHCDDMRTFDLKSRFEVITNLFTSFGYFEHESANLEVLQRVAAHLKPGGVFVLDFMNTPKVIQTLVAEERLQRGGIDFSVTRRFTGSHIVKTIDFIVEGEKHHFEERVQALTPERLEALMEEAGLVPLQRWGTYALEPYLAESSPRAIILAARK